MHMGSKKEKMIARFALNTAFLHKNPKDEHLEYTLPLLTVDPFNLHNLPAYNYFRVKLRMEDVCTDKACASAVNINDFNENFDLVNIANLCPFCIEVMS
jgi:hypothetical protein